MAADKQVTEVTYEVTVRHYVGDDDPNPTEDDIRMGIEYQLGPTFDLESLSVTRV